MECTQGYVLIYFNQETVREQVLQKTNHEVTISGITLKLKVQRADAVSRAEQEINADAISTDNIQIPDTQGLTPGEDNKSQGRCLLVLVENLPEKFSLDMLNLLLENVTEKEEGRDFHVEMVPEIKAAVITFSCSIEISRFVKKFSSNLRVNQMKLSANVLEETKSIRAEGLPPKTSEDHIILYFESPKHGGGEVQETVLLAEEDAALITFQDVRVTRRVLAQKHVFGKTPISVYPYYVSLSVTLYGKNGPSVSIPAPLEIPVSPYILEFILNDAQRKLNIEEKMAVLYCEVVWPDVQSPNLVIKLGISSDISTHLRTLAKIAPTWRDKVSAEFSLLISKYKVAEYKVTASVWEAIKQDIGSSAYTAVFIKPNLAKEKVFLAGFSKDVVQVEPLIGKLIDNTTRRIDRERQSVTISEPLDPAFYEIMSRNGLLKNIQVISPELKLNYDAKSKNLQYNGLKEEVRNAKSEIINIKNQLKSKFIAFDPHIFEFLKSADSKEMSCLLFIRHNIQAMFESQGDTIKLTGYSTKDLSDAEKCMKQELVCKKVVVNDKSIIKHTEWKTLHKYLHEVFNPERCTFLMEIFPPGAESELVISGLSSVVENIYEQVDNFVEENTPLEKTINVKSMAVSQFIKDERASLWGDVKKMNVKFVINQRTITLNGSKSSILKAAAQIDMFLSKLFTDTLRIDKPGAKAFCMDNEDVYVNTAKSKFNCIISFQKEKESSITSEEINLDKPHFQITVSGGVTVAVYKGDLCRHSVDVIVNAANEDLKHVGGLALALLRAAGPKLQSDCDRIVMKEGTLSPGDSVITDAGNLPCKHVVHTVGPRWDPSSQSRCKRLLRRAITSSLELAAENGHNSIAIPAVSAGIFGFPVKQSVETIVESVREYLESHGHKSSLNRIHLVDKNDDIIKHFTAALKDEFGDQKPNIFPKRSKEGDGMSRPSLTTEQTSKNNSHFTTKEGLTVRLIKGNIQDATTDVIVNSVSTDLDLSNGGASRALFHKAGTSLQDDLYKVGKGTQVAEGSVFVTDGGNLSCSNVIHIVAPAWDAKSSSSEKLLLQIINKCLNTSENHKGQSISFPAIGTGALGFPKDKVATLMFDEIIRFSSSNIAQYLQEVHVVLHPSDTGCITAFSSELSQRAQSQPQTKPSTKANPSQGPAFFGTVTSPALGVHKMKIGSILYQVKTGDITKEDTDIIVNSSNRTFNLNAGVSKAIMEAAGQSVQDECSTLGSQPHKGYIITQAGNLLCKKIFHVYISSNTVDEIKKCVKEALQECDKLLVKSIAFPALGTGGANLSSSDVAEAMLEALASFAKSAVSIKKVKVVIFQQNMLNDFHTSMKKMEGSNPKKTWLRSTLESIVNYFTPNTEDYLDEEIFELKEDIDPAIFHVCGESKERVKDTVAWLRGLILKEQYEQIIKDDWIKDFGRQELEKLRDLQKKFHVTVSFALHDSKVIVAGLTRDVLRMSNEIQTLINDVRDKKSREREAQLYGNLVEWRYHDGTKFIPFDIMMNMELEKAKVQNQQSPTVDIRGVKHTVNMELKSASDGKGNTVKIERVSKNEQSLKLPSHWAPMDNDQVKVIQLNFGCQEYMDVQGQFAKTCQMKIIKIERIQNQHLWLNYQIKKQSIDAKNGTTNNEKQLFHGTALDKLKTVNHNGFNRSYAGMNAACYGNGTYFAVAANYSAHDTYSKPDGNGYKYMYLAQVITGITCRGQSGLVAPPPKNPSNPTDLHDSLTDNVTNPSMYVIFNDIQAYPEYLITFSK
ncbi:protein mono-ADP-ribosyltransferase PARP14 isoform X1 [Pelobates fuscus]